MAHFKHFGVHHHDKFIELQLEDTAFYDVIRYTALQDELLEFVAQHRPKSLVVTFDQIRYCSTALINGVLNAQNRLEELGGKLKLCGMSESVRDAFRSLKLDGTVFSIGDELPAI